MQITATGKLRANASSSFRETRWYFSFARATRYSVYPRNLFRLTRKTSRFIRIVQRRVLKDNRRCSDIRVRKEKHRSTNSKRSRFFFSAYQRCFRFLRIRSGRWSSRRCEKSEIEYAHTRWRVTCRDLSAHCAKYETFGKVWIEWPRGSRGSDCLTGGERGQRVWEWRSRYSFSPCFRNAAPW